MYQDKKQINKILIAGFCMVVGLFFFKFLAEKIWGDTVLIDASFHIISASFVIYILWFFIDQNKNWRVPFFLFSTLILFVISVQRILVEAHDDVGLLLGLIISIISIGIAERKSLKGKLKF